MNGEAVEWEGLSVGGNNSSFDVKYRIFKLYFIGCSVDF